MGGSLTIYFFYETTVFFNQPGLISLEKTLEGRYLLPLKFWKILRDQLLSKFYLIFLYGTGCLLSCRFCELINAEEFNDYGPKNILRM